MARGRPMLEKSFWGGLIILTCAMSPFVYAGKMELTTYYPSPFGEYSVLATNKLTVGTVAPAGGTNIPGFITMVGQVGNPTASTSPTDASLPAGSFFYDTTDTGQFKYKDNNGAWQRMGNVTRSWHALTSTSACPLTPASGDMALTKGTRYDWYDPYTSIPRTNNTDHEMEVFISIDWNGPLPYGPTVARWKAFVNGIPIIDYSTHYPSCCVSGLLQFIVPAGASYYIEADGMTGYTQRCGYYIWRELY